MTKNEIWDIIVNKEDVFAIIVGLSQWNGDIEDKKRGIVDLEDSQWHQLQYQLHIAAIIVEKPSYRAIDAQK